MRQILILFIFVIPFLGCKKEEENPDVQASFDYIITKDTLNHLMDVTFQNCSKNAKSYFWDFYDGTTSTEKDPIHKFSTDSSWIYTKLIAYNGSHSDTIIRQVTDKIIIYKPNIYIYPQKTINLCLNISFPFGGEIIKSIPDYNKGWCVKVDSTGKIDNKYNFLFYESSQPDKFQYKQGWCIAQSDLKSFFIKNLKLYNFSDIEIRDFLEYWIPKLIHNKYYKIYPQTNTNIDNLVKLNFSIQPDNINRLFYGFVGVDKYSKIEEPVLVKYYRQGFYIMEWGGFIK
jgi:hypothetical protein